MSADLQVAIIFAVTKGYLDDIELVDVSRFESEFLKFMKASHKDVLDAIKETGKLEDATSDKLVDAIKEFKQGFTPSAK